MFNYMKNITNIKKFMTDTIIQVRVSSLLKERAENILSAMGLKTSEAIRMFLQQTVNDKKLPFQPHIKIESSAETIQATREVIDQYFQSLVNKSPNNITLKSFDDEKNGNYSDSNLADFKKSLIKKSKTTKSSNKNKNKKPEK